AFATLAAQGIHPAGRWLTHHTRRPTDVFDFDICVPVTTPVAPAGRVKPGVLPAATVARTVYHGPYEGLAAGWGELMAWIEANGHTPREDLWEIYDVGPESGSDSSMWRTELNRPLTRVAWPRGLRESPQSGGAAEASFPLRAVGRSAEHSERH